MGIKIELTGESWDHINALIGERRDNVSESPEPMDFQAVVASFGQRCEAEGYDFEIWKKGERDAEEKKPSIAEIKKEEARAKLRDDLKGSLATVETSPETKVVKAKKNGAEDPEALKAKTILRLHELFDKHKVAVMKILADHGGGAKNFNAVPADGFVGISKALAELEATL